MLRILFTFETPVNSMATFSLPLLYPCGAQRRDVLLNKLNEAKISCSQCTVYDSVQNPGLAAILKDVADELKVCFDKALTVIAEV